MSDDIRLQIRKDAALLDETQVFGVTWHFYKNPLTGEVGADDNVINALLEAGIGINFED